MSQSLSLEKFRGKLAVVTGASAGIGKSTAESLVKQGLVVAAVARRLDRLEELSQQLKGEKGKLHPYKLDVANKDEVLEVFKKIVDDLGPIHILLNNAGTSGNTEIIDGDIELWKKILDINLLAVAICSREAIRSMKDNKIKGHIININSILGHVVVDSPRMSVYPASKHAVTALTETLRLEINRAKLPIKITSISPGVVKTEIFEAAYGKEMGQKVLESRPGLSSQDIADAVLYVLSTPEHVNVKELTISIQGEYA